MHFTGRTWRPPYEASSFIVQVTSGCTHNKCSFCSLYKSECFRMSPLEEFKEDLAELASYQPTARRIFLTGAGCTHNKCSFCSLYKNECFRMSLLEEFKEDLAELASYQPTARRIFLTGANPFVMSYENLAERALLIHDYFVECQTIAMFSSIRDIKNKKVWQLRRLRSLGINGISIGTESGDNSTLLLANKGYTAKDLIEQCRKLDEAGIEYYFVYMTGLAGKGNGYRNAVNSAKVFSKVNPRFISVDSLKLFPDTELYRMAQERNFIPAGEKERLEELQTFIKHLQIRTHLFANSVSNF
ncbi:putative uncharacterized protein [Firmicutes bacterium CAG:424]|nr:putative uncharacterized protein [Firmicutes bacterium CAG:424]